MKKLFDEFSEVTAEQWREQIAKDLKGTTFEQLVSHSHNGISIHPFYSGRDLKNVSGILFNNPEWEICEQILVNDEQTANEKALKALKGGASGISFYIHKKINTGKLLKGIAIENIYSQFFISNDALHVLDDLREVYGKKNKHDSKIKCFVNIDPLCLFAYYGEWQDNREKDLLVIEKLTHVPVNISLYEEAGASTINELAIGLSHLNEYLNYLTERKKADKKIFHFTFSIGPDFFTEIAKLRAFRKLVSLLQEQYNSNAEIHIHAQTAMIDKSKMDIYNNLLRTTTEAMSAIIGGADSIAVLPYNEGFEKNDEFASRLARNQQHILKNESYLNKVADVSAGSYYIESITDQLAEKAWEQFKVIEAKGGFISCMKKNFIQHIISKDLLQLKKELHEGKLILLGVNKFQNPKDRFSSSDSNNNVFNAKTEVTPIRPVRLAAGTENEKAKTFALSKA